LYTAYGVYRAIPATSRVYPRYRENEGIWQWPWPRRRRRKMKEEMIDLSHVICGEKDCTALQLCVKKKGENGAGGPYKLIQINPSSYKPRQAQNSGVAKNSMLAEQAESASRSPP